MAKGIPTILLVLLVGGCVGQNDPRLAKISDLEASLADLQRREKTAQEQVESLQNDLLELQIQVHEYSTAIFDPGNPGGYGRIDTTGGTFMMSIQNVTPYVDGFRVKCNVGNPSAATFHGFKLKAKWGPRSPLGHENAKISYSQWRAALREKELSLTDVLQPGLWNPLSFVLSPATPDEFGYLELSMETSSVSFR